MSNTLKLLDKEIYTVIEKEKNRQEEQIELIASENYASINVMIAQGSVLTNKYAEGYPYKRYYGGCENVDIAEDLAINRIKKLFKVNYANVQPHSGSQANAAVFFALLKPGDIILGMSLQDGGHLTHGSKVNFSGKIYNSIQYGLNPQGDIDYQQVEDLAVLHKPKMIIAGFSAFSGIINWSIFRKIANKVNAYLLADIAHVAGLIATNLYPSPINHAHIVTSTTHKTLRGPRGGIILSNEEDIGKKIQSTVFPGLQGGPLMHVIAAKAVAFKEALQPSFIEYQSNVIRNAKAISKVFEQRSLKLVSKACNHLLLINLKNKVETGLDIEQALESINITVNKNSIPNDTRSPFITSGIRIGTPAITTRGFKIKESEMVAHWICDIIDDYKNEKLKMKIKNEVKILCNTFPVYK